MGDFAVFCCFCLISVCVFDVIPAVFLPFLISFEFSNLKLVDIGAKNVQIHPEMPFWEHFVRPV